MLITYRQPPTGQWQLWKFDKLDKSHLQLTRHGGYSGYMYQRKLYFSKRDHTGLWVLKEGKERKIINHFSNIN